MHAAPAVRLRVWDRGYFPFVHVPALGVRGGGVRGLPSIPYHVSVGASTRACGARGVFFGLPSAVVVCICAFRP